MIGKRLKASRLKLHMSGKEFAAMLNISPPALSSIENGKRNITSETIQKIAELQISGTQLDIIWILTGKNAPPDSSVENMINLYNVLDDRGKFIVRECIDSHIKWLRLDNINE